MLCHLATVKKLDSVATSNIIKTTFHATFRPFHLLWFIHNKERKVINLYVHVTVHRNKFLFHKTNKKHEFPKFYFVKKKTLHVSDISFAHQQESSTVHSTLVYFLQVWWQLPSGARMELLFHPDPAWKRSLKTCMKLTDAGCTVENSWWRAKEMHETCRVFLTK